MKIALRPIKLDDAPTLIKWRNDERVINHCLSRATITEESNREFYKNNIETGKYKQFIVECIIENYPVIYPIATVYLKDLDNTNKRCELCLFTSTDTEWEPESQSIAIKMLVDKAFNEYDMHKVYSYVFCKYPDEKDEALNSEGNYEDLVRLSIINTK